MSCDYLPESLWSLCTSGSFSISTGMITAHQLYNYITDHASTYSMKPLRMSKAVATTDNKKGTPDLHEYALVALWNRYKYLRIAEYIYSPYISCFISTFSVFFLALVRALTRIWRACTTMMTLTCPWWCAIMPLHLKNSQMGRGICWGKEMWKNRLNEIKHGEWNNYNTHWWNQSTSHAVGNLGRSYVTLFSSEFITLQWCALCLYVIHAGCVLQFVVFFKCLNRSLINPLANRLKSQH